MQHRLPSCHRTTGSPGISLRQNSLQRKEGVSLWLLLSNQTTVNLRPVSCELRKPNMWFHVSQQKLWLCVLVGCVALLGRVGWAWLPHSLSEFQWLLETLKKASCFSIIKRIHQLNLNSKSMCACLSAQTLGQFQWFTGALKELSESCAALVDQILDRPEVDYSFRKTDC